MSYVFLCDSVGDYNLPFILLSSFFFFFCTFKTNVHQLKFCLSVFVDQGFEDCVVLEELLEKYNNDFGKEVTFSSF